MSEIVGAAARIARLRAHNPAAVALARVCALAARVEPALLRRLRLLLPEADAAAEADLWFSDLLAGRDATALALDPVVADVLRDELRVPALAGLREAAGAEIAAAHAGAHWSVRIEERIHQLHVVGGPGADEEIDDLMMAALDALRTEPDPRGIARWLLGAAGRLPHGVVDRATCRASTAAAMLHLDRQAPAPDLLDAGESQTWLPWLAGSLPTVRVPVRLLDGAVILGGTQPADALLDVPDTDPLVIEVRWTTGPRPATQRVRFRLDSPVHLETGTRAVTLTTLTGASHELSTVDDPVSAGLNFDHLKQKLRPCLARDRELAGVATALSDPTRSCTLITGRPGSGTSTVLVAAADAARANGLTVIEHFFTEDDDAQSIDRSLLAQLQDCYPEEFAGIPLGPADVAEAFVALRRLSGLRSLTYRPLLVVLDDWDIRFLLPDPRPAGVHFLATTRWLYEFFDQANQDTHQFELDSSSDHRVCLAMIERARPALERAFVGIADVQALVDLADDLPGKLADILDWVVRQPGGTVTLSTIPPITTKLWADFGDRVAAQFDEERVRVLFDILGAAHGRHSVRDCLKLNGWEMFWRMCLDANLVVDVPPDGIVELTVPAAAGRLHRPGRFGDAAFGVGGRTPAELAFTESPTWLAAVVSHTLAVGDHAGARRLCTDLAVLRRRYAEDVDGLLADLDTVGDADLASLRSVIHELRKSGVPPADFTATLHDRLVAHGLLGTVPDFGDPRTPLPPLRVRQTYAEEDLRASAPVRTHPGPVHALAQQTGTQLTTPGAPDGIVLIADAGMSTMEGEVLVSGWTGVLGATRGRSGGFALWTENSLWADTMWDHEWTSGRIDRVERLATSLAVADPDGGVTLLPMPGFDGPSGSLSGHGARVTTMVDFAGRVLVGAEDGSIRLGSATLSAHRAAVRAIVPFGYGGFVSAGADGCVLLWNYDDHNGTRIVARQHAGAPVTALSALDNDIVVVGTADGEVHTWNPATGEAATLGAHVGPVHGITAISSTLLVSWSASVRFWNPLAPNPALAQAIGFPGNVNDVLVGAGTFTALCGDGSVQRRPRPDIASEDTHVERAALTITQGVVLAGLGNGHVEIGPSGPSAVIPGDRPLRAMARLETSNVFLSATGGVSYDHFGGVLEPPLGPIGSIELLSTSGANMIATAAGHEIKAWLVFPEKSTLHDDPSRDPRWMYTAPAPVTSVATLGRRRFGCVAGLADGDTLVISGPSNSRTLSGLGAAITAVAVLDDGAVITGSAAGIIQCWPNDPAHGPLTFPPRAGAITALATAGPWLLSAGEDGLLVLRSTDPRLRPVHEISLGAPILALAAEDTLVAARDAHGRLWTFVLDIPEQGPSPAGQLDFHTSSADGTLRIILSDDSDGLYELTRIRVRLHGDIPVAIEGPWPRLEPDGTLTVPDRPRPGRPWHLVGPAPSPESTEAPDIFLEYTSRHGRYYLSTVQLQDPPS